MHISSQTQLKKNRLNWSTLSHVFTKTENYTLKKVSCNKHNHMWGILRQVNMSMKLFLG